jgi:hypothetical protein
VKDCSYFWFSGSVQSSVAAQATAKLQSQQFELVPPTPELGNTHATEVTVTPLLGRSQKRVILSDISPVNQKRTAVFSGNVVTPNESSDGLHINPQSLHN